MALLAVVVLLVMMSDRYNLIELSDYRQQIAKSLSTKYGLKVNLDDKLILKFLPSPYVYVSNVSVAYDDQMLMKGSGVRILMSLQDLPSMFDIQGLSLGSIKVASTNAYLNVSTLSAMMKNSSNNKSVRGNFVFDTLDLVGIDDINHHVDDVAFRNVNYDVTDTAYSLTADIIANNLNVRCAIEVSTKQDDVVDVTIDAKTHGATLQININDLNIGSDSLKGGNIAFAIKDIQALKANFNQQLISNDSDSFLNTIIGNMKSDDIRVTAEIHGNSEGGFEINNVKLISDNSSEDIDVIINTHKVDDDLIEINANALIDKINFDVLSDVMGIGTQKPYHLLLIAQDLFHDIILPKNIDAILNLRINSIITNNEEIRALKFQAYNVMGDVIVKNFSMILPKDSEITLSGVISQNNIRPKFEGLIDIRSTDYQYTVDWYDTAKLASDGVSLKKPKRLRGHAKISAISHVLKIFDILLESDDIVLGGGVFLYDTPHVTPARSFFLSLKNFNFDEETSVSTDFSEYIKMLYTVDYDRNGESYFKITNDNNWLRCMKKTSYFNLDMQDIVFMKRKFNSIKAQIEVAPSSFSIDKMQINTNDGFDGTLQFKFFLPVFRPQITAKINFANLDLGVLGSILPSINEMYQYKDNYLSLKRPNHYENINFFSVNHYDGNLEIKIDVLTNGQTKILENIDGNLEWDFGTVTLRKLSGNIWDGKIDVSARTTATAQPEFQLNFHLDSINPSPPFLMITGLDKINGYMSVAGNVMASGRSWDDVSKNINGNVKFVGAQITFDGFDLNQIVSTLDNDYTVDSKVQSINYYTKYGSTLFDEISGGISLQKSIAKIDNIQLKNSRIAGVYSAYYNLNSKSINGVGVFSFIPISGSKAITVQIKGKGTIHNMQNFEVDASEAINYAEGK